MFYVYAIYSAQFDKIYIGFTHDLEGRLSAHNHISNKGWSSKYKPWQLLHAETFESKPEAMARERQLKSAKGRLFVRSKISDK